MIGLAALRSHERIKLTSGTLIGSCFVLSYALEMFPRYFCEKTETQLAVTAIVTAIVALSRLDMTAVSLNCLKFSLTSVKTRLVVMNIMA